MRKLRTFGLVATLLVFAGIAPVVAAATCCTDSACCDMPCCDHARA